MKRLHYALTLALLTASYTCQAGWNVPVTNFAVADYAAGTQNWQLVTTANNWLYAANNYGLLEYDGSQWRVYGMYYGNLPRSIAKLDDRAIFIGATNDIGVFTPTTKGGMHYTSFITDGNAIEANFGEVWDIEFVNRQVYFFARHRIITAAVANSANLDSIALTDIRTVSTDSRIFCAEEIGGAIYVGTDDGLYLLSGTRMNRIHGSDILRGYEVRCIQALDDTRLLIATDLGGLYLYDGSRITSFRTDADAFLRKNQLYTFAIRGDVIALGTVLQGIVVMDTRGKNCRYISRKDGLQNNTILSMTFDSRANLWVGLDQGIDYVQLASTRQYLSDEQTNFGAGYAALRVQERGGTHYYYGTNQALYTKTDPAQPLQLVEGSMGQVWSLSEIDGTVYCCHNRGLFVVSGASVQPICTDEGFWKVQRLPDGRILAGSYSGFRVIEPSAAGRHWQTTMVKGFDDTAFRWQVDATGAIWAVDASGVVYLTWQDPTTLTRRSVQPYNAAHDWLNISRLGEKILITSLDYCRVVNPDGMLRRDTALFAQLGGETYYALTMQDSEGNILYVRDGTLYIRTRESSSAALAPARPLYSGETDFIGGFENVYPTVGGYVVGTLQGFCLLKPSAGEGGAGSQLYLRELSLVNHDGEIVYGESLADSRQPATICELPYDSYALRFSCAINRTPAGNTQYAFRLQPRDKEFTPMSSRAYYECSSLEQGRYTLQVVCRTAQENMPPEQITRSWTFTIRPPWYRTWWARTLLVLLILFWLLGIGYIIYVMADSSKRKTLHEQQLRILHLENDRTQYRLDSKSRELTRILHEEANRQEEIIAVTDSVDKTLRDLQAHNLKKVEERLLSLRERLMQERDDSIDWQRFEENFDEVNAGFCKHLTERYPWMSKQERKLCVYIRMGMLTKEMAPLLGLSTRGVEMMRYRMRCKMELDPQANLKDYLTKITSNT
ncbi:MAG: hypothetical protein J5823_01280 [Paludibacteraceae bacterium]|nr:hypothetical protein [Paludibacteraceae bacterium]